MGTITYTFKLETDKQSQDSNHARMTFGDTFRGKFTLPPGFKARVNAAEHGEGQDAPVIKRRVWIEDTNGNAVASKVPTARSSLTYKGPAGDYVACMDFSKPEGGLYGSAEANAHSLVSVSLSKS